MSQKTELILLKASHLIPFFSVLKKLNIDVKTLLANVGYTPEQFDDPENLVLEEPAWAFLEEAALASNKIDFGTWSTQQIAIDKYGTFGEKIINCGTLYSSLNTFLENMHEQTNAPTFWLYETQQGVWFSRYGVKGFKRGAWQVEQHVLTLMLELVRVYLGENWNPKKIKLQHHTIDDMPASSLYKQVKTYLSQNCTAIFIPSSKLNARIKNQPNIINHHNRESIPEGLSKQIRILLRQEYFGRDISADKITKRLDFHPRTLQRKLALEGTSLIKIIQAYKINKACELLSYSNLKIIEIAFSLGYSDTANFSHCFKRIKGLSPSQYRKNTS